MKPISIARAALLAAALTLGSSAAATSHEGKNAAPSAMAEGEIRKVDKDAAKVTIKHGPLENLDMPSMTMVFRVKDPAMLDRIKPGDRVRFVAEKVGGQFTVIRLEAEK